MAAMNDVYALIVEDQADSAELVARILMFHNRAFRIAASAEQALEVLEEFWPRVILVDLALPRMSGWELLRVIRNMPLLARVPVVATTAFHSSSTAREAVEAGFDAYFAKPLDATSFLRELDRLVEHHQ